MKGDRIRAAHLRVVGRAARQHDEDTRARGGAIGEVTAADEERVREDDREWAWRECCAEVEE